MNSIAVGAIPPSREGVKRQRLASQTSASATASATPRPGLRQRLLQAFRRPVASNHGDLAIEAAPRRGKEKRETYPPRRLRDVEEAAMAREMFRL